MDQRTVLVLRFYDGFTVTETAEALRTAPGTVKSRTSRALAALRAGGLLAHARPTDLEAPMAEDDLADREVSRLLSLTADRVGRSTAPDPAGLVRRAGRRERARHTGAIAAVLLAVLAVVVLVGLLAANRDTAPPRPADTAVPPAPSPLGTAAALAAGHWEDLPRAPISPRTSPAYTWTGSQLLLWGGYVPGTEGPKRLSDGAGYDPATKTWTLLPAGSLEAVPNPVSAWTGTQWFILGSTPSDTQIRQQLVSYDPATRARSMTGAGSGSAPPWWSPTRRPTGPEPQRSTPGRRRRTTRRTAPGRSCRPRVASVPTTAWSSGRAGS